MDDGTLLDKLRTILVQVIGAGRVPPNLGADMALGDGGLWLDSVDLLQVVLACEAEFGITFEPAEDLVGEGLRTLGTLALAIRRRSGTPSTAVPAPEPS